MAKRKTKRKSKARRVANKKVPRRIQFLVFFLLIVAAAGVLSVKWLQTPAGRVMLVDRGFPDYYAIVQDTLDVELRQAMRVFGLHRVIDEGRRSMAIGKRRVLAFTWKAQCQEECSLAEVNLEIQRAVSRAGGVVRKSVERDGDPPTLHVDVGTATVSTHLITIQARAPSVPPPPPPKPAKPRLAIVIDDFGYSKSGTARSILALDLPLTVAIIPTLRHSNDLVLRARARGKLPIMHLPMEPHTDQPEDVMWIATSMTASEVTDRVSRYLDALPGVAGVNNHLGSRATEDSRVMEAALRVIKGRDLFFLDSLTSEKSIAYTVAKRLGLPAARNDIFLDADTEDPDVVEDRLLQLIAMARARGHAIGIGHPKRWTYEAIARNVDRLKDSGVELVLLSDLVE